MSMYRARPLLALLCGIVLGSAVQIAGADEQAAMRCLACHEAGALGLGAIATPIIHGQPAVYLIKAMARIKSGERQADPAIRALFLALSDADLLAATGYLAKQPWIVLKQQMDAGRVARGKEIADQQCEGCHADNGRDSADGTPRLAGQVAEYLQLQLRRYRDPQLNMPQPKGMMRATQKLTDEELRALAAFYASQE